MDMNQRQRAGTTVFVGRGFFRMSPGAAEQETRATEAAKDGATADGATTGEAMEGGPHGAVGGIGVGVLGQEPVRAAWFAPSEPVMLLPPDNLMMVGASASSDSVNRVGQVDAVEHQASQTFAALLNPRRRMPRQRSAPVWAIVIALVAGATATLSAQAVMRRPGRHRSAPSTLAVKRQAPIQTATVSPSAASAPAGSGVIAAGGVEATAATGMGTSAPHASPIPSEERREHQGATHNGRVPTARATRARPDRPARPMARATGAWVDPFVNGFGDDAASQSAGAAGSSAKPGKSDGKRREPVRQSPTGGSTTKRWVDPFAS